MTQASATWSSRASLKWCLTVTNARLDLTEASVEHNLILINIFNKKIKIKNCFFFIAPIIEYYFIIFKQK